MIIPAMSLTLYDGLLDTDTCFASSTSATDQCQSASGRAWALSLA